MSRRIAATLLLTRGDGPDLEIFVAARAPQLVFFGGYLALPGGTLEPEDGDPELDRDATIQACGRRELFEETGLLLCDLDDSAGQPERLAAARQELVDREARRSTPKGESAYARLVGDAPTPAPLRHLCRVVTPAFAPVRYDTEFLHVPIERCTMGTKGTAPDIWPGELTEGRWWKPESLLESWRKGEVLLVPPLVILCEHLAAAADFEAFCSDIAVTTDNFAKGHLHRVRFTPGIVLAPLQTPTLPPATTTNCYLVGNEQLWIVDPGSPEPEEQQRLLRLLDELVDEGAKLAGILATHHHPDHTGGITALSQARNLPVRGHPLTLERLPAGSQLGEPLEDGDCVPLGRAPDGTDGWHLRCLYTPGHDRGHLCFLESRYQAAIVGDMISTISTIIIDPPEGHLATYLQSLRRMLDEPINTLYPAHGPAARQGHPLIEKYLRHRQQREASLQAALRTDGSTIDELLGQVYNDTDPRLHPFARRSLLAGLEKLADEGHAEQVGDDWRRTDS